MKPVFILLLLVLVGGAIAGYFFFRSDKAATPQTENTTIENSNSAATNTNSTSDGSLGAEEQELDALNLNTEFRTYDALERDLTTPEVDVDTSL